MNERSSFTNVGSPAFIVGMPRSGTTLLSMQLNRHRDVAVAPETHYYDKFRPWRWPAERKLPDFIHKILSDPVLTAFEFTDFEVNDIVTRVQAGQNPGHPRLLQLMLATWARRHRKTVLVEKTPSHAFHLSQIRADFPGGRFLHVVRDPRDVLVSLREVPWRRRSVLGHVGDWARCARLQDKLGANLLEVRYEDLVNDTDRVLARVSDFLGVESGAWLEQEALPLNYDPIREPWKRGASLAPDPSRIGRWRNVLDQPTLYAVDSKLGGLLESEGYRRSGVSRPATYPLRLALWWLTALLLCLRRSARRIARRIRRSSGALVAW